MYHAETPSAKALKPFVADEASNFPPTTHSLEEVRRDTASVYRSFQEGALWVPWIRE